MKRIEHEVERTADRVTIKAVWADKMRNRRNVTVSISAAQDQRTSIVPAMLTGDVRDVSGVLNGIAQIAWDQGWRPAGLGATLAAVVERFKEPKAE